MLGSSAGRTYYGCIISSSNTRSHMQLERRCKSRAGPSENSIGSFATRHTVESPSGRVHEWPLSCPTYLVWVTVDFRLFLRLAAGRVQATRSSSATSCARRNDMMSKGVGSTRAQSEVLCLVGGSLSSGCWWAPWWRDYFDACHFAMGARS